MLKGLLFSVFATMLLNFELLFPALLLLILHFLFGIALKWSLLAFLAFVLWAVFLVLLLYIGRGRSIPKKGYGISLHPGRDAYFDRLYKNRTASALKETEGTADPADEGKNG